MGDGYLRDLFGITAGILQVLEMMMMQRYLNAKSAQVNQARAAGISPGGWERGGGRTWNHHAECFTLRGAGNPTAPAWNSACLWRQPGLGSQWIYPATTRCTGVKGFCRSQPGPKLSLCQVAQVSVHHASGVLQYRESQPCVSPADGELSINQCLFSMICLQSPELTWLTAVWQKYSLSQTWRQRHLLNIGWISGSPRMCAERLWLPKMIHRTSLPLMLMVPCPESITKSFW